jgi:hypothetical protein
MDRTGVFPSWLLASNPLFEASVPDFTVETGERSSAAAVVSTSWVTPCDGRRRLAEEPLLAGCRPETSQMNARAGTVGPDIQFLIIRQHGNLGRRLSIRDRPVVWRAVMLSSRRSPRGMTSEPENLPACAPSRMETP